jgi:hypothetical protein
MRMKVYWSARQVPELSHLSRRQAWHALRNCWRSGIVKFPHALGLVLFWVLSGPFWLARWLDMHVAQHGDIYSWLVYLCAGLLAYISCEVLFSFLIENARPKIREYMATQSSV